jgi:uncharacterized protein YceH (UPF0502 family)
MLRGPQTPGELKQRSDRLHPFTGLDQVHETLEQLVGRELVERLERRPGQKEVRYRQLRGGGDEITSARVSDQPAPGAAADLRGRAAAAADDVALGERLDRVEAELAELRDALAELRARVAVDG